MPVFTWERSLKITAISPFKIFTKILLIFRDKLLDGLKEQALAIPDKVKSEILIRVGHRLVISNKLIF